MNVKHLSPEFAVSGQITPAEVAAAAGMGFRAIVCNRPDGEEANQPASAEIRAAAQAAGLAFRDIPFAPGKASEAEVRALDRALGELPSPVLAYCRSGGRASSLWSLVQEGRQAAR